MRLKQQSFLEKYIEKIILGVAVLIALVIVYFYVLSPYAVEVAPGQVAGFEAVEESYKRQVQQLSAAINRSEPPQELVNLKIPDYVNRFDARYYQRLVQSDSFYAIVVGNPGVQHSGPTGTGPVNEQLVDVVAPPPAKDIVVATKPYVLESDQVLNETHLDQAFNRFPLATEAAIRDVAADWTSQAVAIVGNKEPRDFFAVSLSGQINLQDWIDKMKAGDADKAIPAEWYRDLVGFIADIEVRRQTLNPATGEWSDDTIVKPLPGAVSLLLKDYVKQVQDSKVGEQKRDELELMELRQELVEKLGQHRDDLTKPQFLPVKSHRAWQPPDEVPADLGPEDQQAIMKLNQQIAKYESELRILDTQAAAPGVLGPRTTNPEEFYNPDGRGGVRPLPPVPPRTPPRTPPKAPPRTPPKAPKAVAPGVGDAAAKRKEERILFYRTKLADLYEQKNAILAKLIKEEVDPNDPNAINPDNPDRLIRPNPRPLPRPGRGEFDPNRFGEFRNGEFPGRPGSLAGADGKMAPMKFWVHDAQVESGKTYRYQIVYKIISPLFNKEAQLVDAQKKLASELLLASEPTEWTEPVTIERELQFFVEDVRAETSTVTWGVYRIHNGYRIHKQFATRPGDSIGDEVEIQMKDETGAPAGMELVDMRVPALLIDLKAPANKPGGGLASRGPMTVLLADLETGAVGMRDPLADPQNEERIRLFNEAAGVFDTAGPVNPAGDGLAQPGREFPRLPPPLPPGSPDPRPR